MVRVLYILFMVLIPLCVMANQKPLTGDDLRRLLSDSENEHAVHARELKSNRLHELLKPVPEDEETAPKKETTPDEGTATDEHLALPKAIEDKPKATENNFKFFSNPTPPRTKDISKQPLVSSVDSPAEDKEHAQTVSDVKKTHPTADSKPKRRTPVHDEDRYVPPSWQFSAGRKASPIHSAQADVKKGPFFGIRLGTEFRAKLIRTTTNIEPTLTEFVVTDDVFGDFKMLSKNTKLYADKNVSDSSNRIYFNTVKGITPDGEEFEINATITDVSVNKLAGLTGAITTDNKLLSRSASNGAIAAGGEFVKQLASDSILGTAASAAAETAISEKEDESDARLGKAKFVIFVNPQEVFIRVDESF